MYNLRTASRSGKSILDRAKSLVGNYKSPSDVPASGLETTDFDIVNLTL